MNISYLLKSEVDRKKKPIYIVVRNKEGRKFRFNTGIDIDPKDWRKKGGYPVANGRTSQIRNSLDKIRDSLERWYQEVFFNENRNPTKEEITTKVDELAFRKDDNGNEQEGGLLVQHFEKFIESKKEDGIADGTIKKYRVTLNHLKEFDKTFRLEDVGKKFGDDFSKYLTFNKGHENKSVNKSVGVLKTMLGWCEEKGLLEKGTRNEIPILKEEEQEIVALEPEEIKKLEEAPIESKRLQRVRDLLLFTVYTSIRYGDLYELKPSNFMKNGELHFISNKDQKKQEVPLCKEAVEIAKKYEYKLPVISGTKYNEYIKELFQVLDFDRVVRFVNYYRDKAVEKEMPLYEAVSSHIGRKTFVTDALRRGVNPELVRSISGHSSLEAFKRYIKFSKNDKQGAVERR